MLLLLMLRKGLGMVGRLVVAERKSWRPRSVLVGMLLGRRRRTLAVEMSLRVHGDLLVLEMELLLLLLLSLLLLLEVLLLLLLLLEVMVVMMNCDRS